MIKRTSASKTAAFKAGEKVNEVYLNKESLDLRLRAVSSLRLFLRCRGFSFRENLDEGRRLACHLGALNSLKVRTRLCTNSRIVIVSPLLAKEFTSWEFNRKAKLRFCRLLSFFEILSCFRGMIIFSSSMLCG